MAVGKAVEIGVLVVEEEAAVVDRGTARDGRKLLLGKAQDVPVQRDHVGPPDPGTDAGKILRDVEQTVDRAALVRAGHDDAGLAAAAQDLDLIALKVRGLEALAAGSDAPALTKIPDQFVLQRAGDDDDVLVSQGGDNVIFDLGLQNRVLRGILRGNGADLGRGAGDGADVLCRGDRDERNAVIVRAVAVNVDGGSLELVCQHDTVLGSPRHRRRRKAQQHHQRQKRRKGSGEWMMFHLSTS